MFAVMPTSRFMDLQSFVNQAATGGAVSASTAPFTVSATMDSQVGFSPLLMTASATMDVHNAKLQLDVSVTMAVGGAVQAARFVDLQTSSNMTTPVGYIQSVSSDMRVASNMAAYAVITAPLASLTASSTMTTSLAQQGARSCSMRSRAALTSNPGGTIPATALVSGVTVIDFDRGSFRGHVRGGSGGRG